MTSPKLMQCGQFGFTMIELMIVVVTIGILAVTALPVYQDYIVRTKVSEGLALAEDAKIAVATAFQATGLIPGRDSDAAYAGASSKYVTSVSIGIGGVITVTYNFAPAGIVALSGTTNTLLLTPNINNLPLAVNTIGPIDWACTSSTKMTSQAHSLVANVGTLPANYAPAECR